MATQTQFIVDELRRLIVSGELPTGEQLPSETELAARFMVSKPTLRSALEVLQTEGLVEKFHGRGNFVRHPRERVSYNSERQMPDQPTECHSALDITLSTRETRASGPLLSLLNVEPGTPLTEYVIVSHRGKAPQSLAHVYVPCDVASFNAPATAHSPWGDDIRTLLAQAGVHVVTTAERVTARLPSPEEARMLRIPTRSPVLALERASSDAEGRVVEGALLVLPGDRTEVAFSTHPGLGALKAARQAVR